MNDLHTESNSWSEETLFYKVQLYIQEMESCSVSEWKYGLWSSLALELLARASLAHISPILLANHDNWRHLLYAMGHEPNVKKYAPRSLSSNEVVDRLSELLQELNTDMAQFIKTHIGRRNSELHSGELIFEKTEASNWLPEFYSCVQVLVKSMDRDPEILFDNYAEVEKIIDSHKSDTIKSVRQLVKAHQTVWTNKSPEERDKSEKESSIWASRKAGHRVSCPSCSCRALVYGSPVGDVERGISDSESEIIEKQEQIPTRFECIACGLKISGIEKLIACNLGDRFKETSTYEANEFFGLYTEEELEEARMEIPRHLYEEDFNDY